MCRPVVARRPIVERRADSRGNHVVAAASAGPAVLEGGTEAFRQGRVPPDVTVRASLTPRTWIPVGGRVRVRVTVINRGPKTRFDLFASYPSEVIWATIHAPAGNRSATDCGSDPYHHACGPDGGNVAVHLRVRQRRSFTWELRVEDFVCPARGDFMTDFVAGTIGPVKRGPNGYTLFTWFANDPDDYAKARLQHPGVPNASEPGCTSGGW